MKTVLTIFINNKSLQYKNDFTTNMNLLNKHIINLSNKFNKEEFVEKMDIITFIVDKSENDIGFSFLNKKTNKMTDFHSRDFAGLMLLYKTMIMKEYKKNMDLSHLQIKKVEGYIDSSEYHDICIEHKELNYDCLEWRTRDGKLLYFKEMSTNHLKKCLSMLAKNTKNEIRSWKMRGLKKEIFLRNLKH